MIIVKGESELLTAIMKTKNIFKIDDILTQDPEVFENILENKDFKIERIVTLKPYSKPREWYDQEKDEWVLLLQGEAELEFKQEKILQINAGDYIFIPAHKKHRINHSSQDQKCIWLAIHGNLK